MTTNIEEIVAEAQTKFDLAKASAGKPQSFTSWLTKAFKDYGDAVMAKTIREVHEGLLETENDCIDDEQFACKVHFQIESVLQEGKL